VSFDGIEGLARNYAISSRGAGHDHEAMSFKRTAAMTPLLLLVNGSLIAGIYALAKVAAAGGVSAPGVLAWQLLFAAPVLAAVAAWRGQAPLRPGRASLRYAAVAGLLGITAPNLLTFAALTHVPAGLIGVIGALSPAFTYAIALALRIERPHVWRAAGIGLGLAGVMAVLLPRGALPADASSLPWALAAIGTPLLLAAGNVFRTRAWPAGLAPLSAASLMLALQAALVVPAVAWSGALRLPSLALAAPDVALLGAGVLTSLFYLSAFELQRRAGAVAVGQLGYVITAASLAIGALAFDERYPATTLLAIGAVLAGVMLVQRTTPTPPRRSAPCQECPA
jgi:drug/metabolite transporter (DMT)-like permease